MEIVPLDLDDDGQVGAWIGVHNAARAADSPWVHPLTLREARGMLRFGWDLEPDVAFLGVEASTPVAAVAYHAGQRDNLHLAWTDVVVAPEHRRRGHGTAALAWLEAELVRLGRTSAGASVWAGNAGEAFAAVRGYDLKQVAVNRRQHLAETDAAALAELAASATAASSDYELVRMPPPSSDDDLERLAVLTAAINDAPTDDLDVEDDVFDAERIRAYETAQRERGAILLRLVARHRATGELAGQTIVAVDGERPALSEQHDTSVQAAHRGHRLGALLKTGMLAWLAEEQPQVTEVDTWNAESNDHMIGVNEALGYRVMGRELNYQKSLG